MKKSDIHRTLEVRHKKINQMLDSFKKINAAMDYQDGSPIPYQGKEINLSYRALPGRIWALDEAGGILTIRTDLHARTEYVLKEFYGVMAQGLKDRCLKLGRQHKLEPGRVTLRWNRSRWGSCSSAGRISLNKALIMAPAKIQDYIILHELCHLIHFNHSRDFYLLLQSLDPDHRQHRKWIKSNGHSLRVKPQSAAGNQLGSMYSS